MVRNRRKPIVRLTRSLAGAGAWALVAPPALLGMWSAAYLANLFDFVTAPGMAVNFEYEGAGGKVRVRAESYAADLGSRLVIAKGLEVTGPDGLRVIRIERAQIRQTELGGLDIRAEGVDAALDRLPNGQFSFLGVIPPPPKEKGPEPPVSFKAENVRLRYRDRTGGIQLNLVAELQEIEAKGVGESWLAAGRARIPNVGVVPFQTSLGPEARFQADLQLNRTELAPLLPVIERYLGPNQKLPFTARSLRATGPLQLDGSASTPVLAYGKLQVNAQDVQASPLKASVQGDLQLYGQQARGALNIKGRDLELKASRFTFDWAKAPQALADGEVRLSRLASLPAEWRRPLPRGLDLQGLRYTGQFGFTDNRWLASGRVQAASVRFDQDQVDRLEAAISATPNRVAAVLDRARWQGQSLSGGFAYDLPRDRVNVFVNAPNLNLGALAQRFDLPLTGRGAAQVVAEAQRGKWNLWLSSQGTTTVQLPNGPRLQGRYQANLSGPPERLQLQRGLFQGPDGTLSAEGWISPPRQTLALAVRGGGIRTATFAQDVQGTAALEGAISGTFSKPQFSTNVDLYELRVADQKLPWVRLQAKGNPDRVALSDIRAQLGFSRINGEVVIEPRTGKLSGAFQSPGIQIAEFAGDRAAGLIQILNGQVSGTLSDPKVLAEISGGPVAFSGATLSGIRARLFATNAFVRIAEGQVSVSDADTQGQLNLTGQMAYANSAGEVQAKWTGIPLRPLAQFDERFAIAGLSDGEANLTFDQKGLKDGTLAGTVADLVVNGQTIGGGLYRAEAKGGEWEANASVGSLDRFLAIDNVRQSKDGKIAGRATAFQLRAEVFSRLARPLWKDAPEEMRQVLADISGALNGALSFSLDQGQFALATDSPVTIGQLQVGGRDLGDLTADIERQAQGWNLRGVQLSQGEQKLSLSGTVGDDGQLNLSARANKVDLSSLTAFNPNLPVIPALADAEALVTGDANNPIAQASINLEAVPAGDNAARDTPPSLNLSFIELRNRQITGEGRFEARGFTGPVTLSSPLSALIAKDGQYEGVFDVQAQLDQRALAEFKDLLPGVDFQKSRGTFRGNVRVRGTSESYAISGEARFSGLPGETSLLAFKDARTELRNPLLEITLAEGKIGLLASAESGQGGSAQARATVIDPIPLDGQFDQWLDRARLTGDIRLDGFKVDEGDMARGNLVQGALQTLAADGQTPGALRMEGRLREPLIAGRVNLIGANADIPQFQPTEGVFAPPVNPRFDIDVQSVGGVRLRTIQSSLVANANAQIRGSLLSPEVAGGLDVRGGTLRLPNARIQLEEGGQVGLAIRPNPDGTALVELPINVTGRTNVNARRGATGFQRYEVSLVVSGDLLRQGDLQITARSDPPDLSQDEILAIIGQRDLLEALAAGAQDTRNQQFRDALIGLFLPTLSEQLTSGLADALNLDYLALDYNPFEGAVISGAKSFNRFLTLEGRRALSANESFSGIRYEFRLVYRVPSQNVLLSRTRFVLSANNRQAYRIAVEYSFRP